MDPTFLYDFNQEQAYSRVSKLSEPYMLVYSYAGDEKATKVIREYARKHNLKTLAVGYRQSWCDRNLMNVGPFEWIDLFRNAETVATSTYHGTIFSLKNKKDFFLIQNHKAHNRVSALLNTLKIKTLGRVQEGAVEFISLKNCDYKPRLRRLTDDSHSWLLSAIRE